MMSLLKFVIVCALQSSSERFGQVQASESEIRGGRFGCAMRIRDPV